LKIDTKQCFTNLFNGLFKHQAASLDFISLLKFQTNIKLYGLCHKKLNFKIDLRWLDTVFKNSGVQHFDMFKLRIFRIYSADIGFFIYFDISTFKLY
jgi:hypothetical protein